MKGERLFVRVTAKEKRILEERAKRYAGGSLSRYIRWCLDNANLPKKNPVSK